MYNAHITENKTLKILNEDSELVNKINAALKSTLGQDAPQISLGNYEFNEEPCSHEDYATVWESTKDIFYDIQSNSEASGNIIKSVEVKASVNMDNAKSFHDAQLVFIYNIAGNKLGIKYRKSKNNYEYLPGCTGLSVDVRRDCIIAKVLPEFPEIRPFSDAESAKAANTEEEPE